MGCGSRAMARTCSSARPDENSVGGADAGTGSGRPVGTAPYNAAPVMTRNVRTAIAAFVLSLGLRSIPIACLSYCFLPDRDVLSARIADRWLAPCIGKKLNPLLQRAKEAFPD